MAEQSQSLTLAEVQAFLSVAESVTSILDSAEIMRRVCREATRLVGAGSAIFWEADDVKMRSWPAAGYHVPNHLYVLAAPYSASDLPGLLVDAFLAREPIFIGEVADEPSLRGSLLEKTGARSVLSMPVYAKGQRHGGLLLFWWQAPGRLTARDVDLVSILTRQGALALENARLHEEIQIRLGQSETLLSVSGAIGSTLELAEVLRRTTREVVRVLGADTGGAWVLGPDGQELRALSGYHVPKDLLAAFAAAVPLLTDHPLVPLVLSSEGPVYATDSASDPRFDYPGLRLMRHRSVLILPVRARGEAIGALVIVWLREPHEFDESELRLASGIGHQAGVAIENARLFEETRQALADLKAAQAQLVQSQTLRALGELASGAAHHLNNLLTIVLGRVNLLLLRCAETDRRPLEIVVRAATDGAEVVRRIQKFAHAKPPVPDERVDLNDVVKEVIELTRGRWQDEAVAHGVRIETVFEPGEIPEVSGRGAELREVVTNLVLNAVDALPRGGRITLATRLEGGQVTLSTSDTGVGMPPETLRRACEPFFTTKGLRSTGLGLSVNYGIVRQHGGALTIESVEGHGTTVTVRLPAAADTSGVTSATVPSRVDRGALRILVVDDEREVRDVIAELIAGEGHAVSQAPGGVEALAAMEAGPLPDLVIADLGMPGMTGWELIRTIRARWPRVAVGLVTGWGTEPPAAEMAASVNFILAKPIQPQQLHDILARIAKPPLI